MLVGHGPHLVNPAVVFPSRCPQTCQRAQVQQVQIGSCWRFGLGRAACRWSWWARHGSLSAALLSLLELNSCCENTYLIRLQFAMAGTQQPKEKRTAVPMVGGR